MVQRLPLIAIPCIVKRERCGRRIGSAEPGRYWRLELVNIMSGFPKA